MSTTAISNSALVAESITPQLRAILDKWIGKARWFTGNRTAPQLEILSALELSRVEHLVTSLLVVRSGEQRYLVPVVVVANAGDGEQSGILDDDATLDTLAALPPEATIGTLTTSAGVFTVWDATEHPQGQRALLEACFSQQHNVVHQSLQELPEIANIEKLRSEQSNTSLIFEFAQPDPLGSHGLIVKLFRLVQIGKNPDIELQLALDASNTRTVAHQYASASLQLPDGNCDFIVAQEFLTGAKDAWQVFQEELKRGSAKPSNPDAIFTLGVLTANIHKSLADHFAPVSVSATARSQALEKWLLQLGSAIQVAPALQPLEPTIRQVFEKAAALPWPDAQRIHGDYHLGQVLQTPDGHWYALDFEGEPLKPLAERTQPSLALRDVAGMLRSFDYAAGAAMLGGQPSNVTGPWAQDAMALFMQGYGTLSRHEDLLLHALMLDKALYEVLYEATYRPRWLPIPVEGVKQLVQTSETLTDIHA